MVYGNGNNNLKQSDFRAHVVYHHAKLHPCREENTVIFNEYLFCARRDKGK